MAGERSDIMAGGGSTAADGAGCVSPKKDKGRCSVAGFGSELVFEEAEGEARAKVR